MPNYTICKTIPQYSKIENKTLTNQTKSFSYCIAVHKRKAHGDRLVFNFHLCQYSIIEQPGAAFSPDSPDDCVAERMTLEEIIKK